MNDADVSYALNHCMRFRPCEECPLHKTGYFSKTRNVCRAKLIQEAFDLLERYKEANEQWKEEANIYQNLWCEAERDAQTVKNEAIKEFAERLKEEALYPYPDSETKIVDVDDIDNLVKEMTEVEQHESVEQIL